MVTVNEVQFRTIKAILPPLLFAAGSAILSVPFPFLFPLALIGLMDAHGRYKDFKYLSKFRYIPVRLVIFYGKSFCGRNVILTIDPTWRHHYHRNGYRWWHILPDGFPVVLSRRRFWIALFKGHRA